MKYLLQLLLLVSFSAGAQVTIQSDTTPVWVVYLDSVRLFAASPVFDMRTEVQPGWMVVSILKDGFEFLSEEHYFDTNGIEMDADLVLFTKRRKIKTNPFRQ